MTERTPGAGPWFVPLQPRPEAGTQLFVFPHAGGGPGAVTPLVPDLPAGIELCSLNLPGRQARLREPPRTDLDGLVGELAGSVAGLARGPFALFGYCSGALLAHLVARRLAEAGQPPARLFAGSCAAPDVVVLPRRLHLLPSGPFWDRLLAEGGVPEELARRVELRPVFEPALRADFALLASYRHAAAAPLPLPITVLYGRLDTSLGRGSLLGWRRQTARRLAMCEIGASHWLVDEAPAEVAQAIAAQMA